ncbi:MAG: formyltransferase family protein [Candidatus Shikimatogenerans sp. AspAUS03]|uniref:Methionyl-tRNA formyltransferase n=1 Tax=Candidatus Shikimatogenerans sp. AspAUS03 TaxID=3158563 RepID=A0AAU7QVC9_9FLAO
MNYKIVFYTNNYISYPSLKFLIKIKILKGIIINKLFFKNNKKIYNLIIKYKINYLFDKYINNKNKILKFLKLNKINLQIVMAFKYIKSYIYNFPKYGTFNIHPSVLPKNIGPNPIRNAILKNEKYTGISIFKINKIIDKGKILFIKKIKIKKKDNYSLLKKKISYINVKILKKMLKKKKFKKKYKHLKINKKLYTKSFKINHLNCKIKWNNKCIIIYNQIRAFYKKPLAWTYLLLKNQKKIKIILKKCFYKKYFHNKLIGMLKIKKQYIKIYCKDGFIGIIKCKLNNKKQTNIKSFINGLKNLNILKCI